MIRTLIPALTCAAMAAATVSTGVPTESEAVAVVGEAILAPTGAALPAATATTTACTDTAYALAPWRLASTYKWYYNPAGAPASVAATALPAMQTASQTVASGRNRCGTTATLTTTQQYLGATTRVAQIDANGACTGNDNYSVTSWGTLPPSYLGYTCVYYRPSTGAIIASDMLLDRKVHNWFTTLPANCSNAYDLESVVAHERGHTAGLAHVDQATHAVETMSPSTYPCAITERTLALGDLTGLKKLYSTP